ncbi:threonine synthase [Labilibaculum manganireducens]|uniref:Threonine synthase n=1 Tax=Labilibaculum manganireducens TaxID=1940525 RepID=A0A2N3HVX0_9BACT|nr:threonine synthase [Labilibaculum manganireducens]PKQ62192.1 threonine synthase [Labilibaculum manganireducens]
MKYFSTNNKDIRYSFKEAVIKGLAPDNGLFFPVSIPKLEDEFFQRLTELSLPEIGYEVAKHFVGDDISDSDLREITEEVLNFPIPVVPIEDGVNTLELFHGPTCAFKDVGARFMSRCLSAFAKQNQEEVTILVATSGDTGSAVANGFLGVEGVKVIILYPAGKVSKIQEQQLTTMGQNITALEVDGTFDDCQALVKTAFGDADLNAELSLTSANSINIARLLPQSFYYFYAWAQLQPTDKKVVFSVPSGNYGNLTGGLLAKQMGLPIDSFIASANTNKVVPDYLSSGKYEPKASVQTISNAMDVGAPSNFARMMELYQEKHFDIVKDVKGAWFSDEETQEAIADVYSRNKYILDPHGAVGYLGLKRYLNTDSEVGVFLETAHPAKFKDTVEKVLNTEIRVPDYLQQCLGKEKKSILISKDFSEFKSFLLLK